MQLRPPVKNQHQEIVGEDFLISTINHHEFSNQDGHFIVPMSSVKRV